MSPARFIATYPDLASAILLLFLSVIMFSMTGNP